MDIKDILEIVKQVGFPITVSLILLLRYEAKIGKLADIMQEINKTLIKISEQLEK